jgi:uncharacterized protein (DUF1499 family)
MARTDGRSTKMDTFGWIAVIAMIAGPTLAWLRVVPPLAGFGIYALGGLSAIVAGVSLLVASARRRGFGAGRAVALLAAMIFVVTASPGFGVPAINDFTTDTADPPQFQATLALPRNQGRDMSYPAEFADTQKNCCADLAPERLPSAPAQAFERARGVAEQMPGWTITAVDAEKGVIEAVSTSQVFGFEDDVVIRVRPEGDGSRVDVRSKSRDGRGDQGVNAARIRGYLEALRKAA